MQYATLIPSAISTASTVIEAVSKHLPTLSENQVYSYVECVKKPNDTLLFKKDYQVRWSLLRSTVIDVPFQSDKVITSILVSNRWKDGTGGYVKIKSGGVGHQFVNINLQSQINRGFHFRITIYGRDK